MIDLLRAVLVAPFADMAGNVTFLVEVLIGGVAAGLMYSLVALGFVLIFKASGVFNFAQGVMVLFAALTLVGLMEKGVPVAAALALTVLVMIALAFAIERIVLRPLVNQEQIILFMATIGLNFFLEGFGEMVWGANYIEQTHYLRVYMGQLRHKLEADPARPRLLITEPAVGYRLRDE